MLIRRKRREHPERATGRLKENAKRKREREERREGREEGKGEMLVSSREGQDAETEDRRKFGAHFFNVAKCAQSR